MNRLMTIFLIIFLCFGATGHASRDKGFPFLKNFSSTDYRAHAQNFDVTHDSRGIVYVGNFAGVLQYDGETWRLIPTGKLSKVSALGVDSKGTVYVGARGEIGFLGPDKQGTTKFMNLFENQKIKSPGYFEIIEIIANNDIIYFVSRNHIFTYRDKTLSIWNAPSEILGVFFVNSVIYIQLENRGLMTWADGTLSNIDGGDMMTSAIEVKSMLPFSGNRVLIATGTQGLFLLESGSVNRFDAQANQLLINSIVTCGTRLSDGTYALGTLKQGIIIVNEKGEVVQIIDRKAGLRNNFIQAVHALNNNILWVALNNGIAMVEIPGPLSFFDEKSGLSGGVNHILWSDNTLYVSTYQGLFYYDEKKFGFAPIPGIVVSCWSVIPYDNFLLAATSQGVYMIQNKKATLIKEGFAISIIRSKQDPSLVFIGEMKGLFSMTKQRNQWTFQQFAGLTGEINDLQQDGYGYIWGSTLTRGIFRFKPGEAGPEYFSQKDGLPDDAGATINVIGKDMSVSTQKGVFVFNNQQHSFDTTTLIGGSVPGSEQWFSIITPAENGDLWVNDGDETHVINLKKNGRHYLPNKTPFLPIADYVFWYIYPETGNITWFGGPEGLIRYDAAVRYDNLLPYPTMIRKITVHGDSLLFAGDVVIGNPVFTGKNLVFRYEDNSLEFEFSAPFYSPKGENNYQYFLEGFDDTWSDWTTQSVKEYTNLPAGKYTFRVKSRNLFGNISQEDKVSFQVLAPWYATIWAIVIYFLLAAAIIYLIVIIRNRQLVKEKRILEQRISDRTAEVVQQKEEIESQSAELANKNEELEKINNAVKSINAEISLENLIQALLEKMKVLKSIENAAALVYDKNTNLYRYTASIGYDLEGLKNVSMTFAQAEARYLKNAEEVYEDIFVKSDFTGYSDSVTIENVSVPKSLMVLVIRVENKVEAFLMFSNMTREHAFEQKDISFIRNSKEHIISAFIRTRIMGDLQMTLQNLKDTQDQLIQSEKLASLGQLTAGIAHEIQNPLNFVNNFSSLSAELTDEISEILTGIKDQIPEDKFLDADEVVGMIRSNVKKINEHGKRAESIVKGMLQHSRGRTGEFEQIEINNMVSEYVNLAYHGMRAKDKSFNTAIRTNLDPEVGKASIQPQDLSRVILNIVNNACYAVDERAKKQVPGYAPEVMVSTKKNKDKIEIHIRDNGTGIPESVKEKIFNPFFTTKPTGKGTGLGLSMSFDIVNQMHKGKLEVLSQEGEFTEFIITIPEKQS